ncbi:MAG TPA: MFS transporter [Acidimicrobiales bacterium]|nr:MFS transporter [Acidimicrobiales bacterium]
MTRAQEHARVLGDSPARTALLPLLLGTFVGTLNNNIVNVPLRAIMRDLHVGLSRGALVVISFNLSLAIFMPLAGWGADRFGRRRVFVCATLALAASSIGSSAAPSLGILVAFRVLQGVSGAAILPCVMGLITDLYGQSGRSRALGFWASANGLGQTIGPPLGGVLASWLSWRWIFAPSVPLAALAAAGAVRFVPASRPRPIRLEWRGAALLTVGVGLVVSAVTAVAELGPASPAVGVLGAGGVAALAAFVHHGRRRAEPFVDPRLLAEPSFLRSSTAVCAQMFCLGATVLAVPLYLTRTGHRTTAEVGLVVFALPAAMTLLAPLAGIASERLGPRRVLRSGMTVLVVSEAVLAGVVGAHVAVGGLVAALVLVGTGIAFVQTPAATGATRSEAGRVGTGLGVFNLVRFAGSALGGAWATIALTELGAYPVVFVVCSALAALGLGGTWSAPRPTPTATGTAPAPGDAPTARSEKG